MTPDQIRASHASIRQHLAELEAVVAGDRPAQVDGLAARRWAFTREMLHHCSRMNTLLTGMAHDARPQAAHRAVKTLAETERLVAAFRTHVGRWHGFPPPEQWEAYRRAVRTLTMSIRALIDGEAWQIVPLLPVQALARPDPVRSEAPMHSEAYAADAFAVRRMIYREDGRPLDAR